MLGDANVYATIPVKNLEESKAFYEQILNLRKIEENTSGAFYRCGISKLKLYVSPFAGATQATLVAWDVQREQLDLVVESLKLKGVVFEHYDNLPDTVREGDIHEMGLIRAAWFKDPSGNLLTIGNTG